ncbi:MAG: hypothetical protein R3E66_09035 [bacterium]
MKRHEIDRADELARFIASGESLAGWVIQGLDVRDTVFGDDLHETLFIGCEFVDKAQQDALVARGAHLFPPFQDLPYDPYRSRLYSVGELLEGIELGYTGSRDFQIYTHFDRHRNHAMGVPIREALAQRLHDHAIDDALDETISELGRLGTVGVMGGHSTRRDDPYYRTVALTAWHVTRAGYLIASGGGPGIMEAANLGAYLASYRDPKVVDAAIAILSRAPKFDGGQAEGTPEYLQAIQIYVEVARHVCASFYGPKSSENAARYGREDDMPGQSIAVPTWFYGHEPTNLFGLQVAKYFSNSLREDGLLALSTAGVIYAPGSAGTLQEVFMDLAQNHYATFKVRSPMVFVGREVFEDVYALIRGFVERRGMAEVYGDMITMLDEPTDILEFIQTHPPRPRKNTKPLYELV